MSNQIFSGSQNLIGAASSLMNAYGSGGRADPKFITITSKMLSVSDEGDIVEDLSIPAKDTFTKKFLISNDKGPFTEGYVYIPNLSNVTVVTNSDLPSFLLGLPIYVTTDPTQCKRQFAQISSSTGPWKQGAEIDPNTLPVVLPKFPTPLTYNNSYNIPQSTLGGFILGSFNFDPTATTGFQSVPQPFPFGFLNQPETNSPRTLPTQYVYTESIYLSYENNKSYLNFVFKNPAVPIFSDENPNKDNDKFVDITGLADFPTQFLIFLTI